MTATSSCAPFMLNSATCMLITARSNNSAAYHLTSLLWQNFSNIFCKVLQQQSFSTNGTDGDGKHAGICRKRQGCHQRMAFSRARVSRLLPAASFDSSTASPVPGKVENDAKVSLPDHKTQNKVSIRDFFFFFHIQPRVLEGLFIVRKGCEKLWR